MGSFVVWPTTGRRIFGTPRAFQKLSSHFSLSVNPTNNSTSWKGRDCGGALTRWLHSPCLKPQPKDLIKKVGRGKE